MKAASRPVSRSKAARRGSASRLSVTALLLVVLRIWIGAAVTSAITTAATAASVASLLLIPPTLSGIALGRVATRCAAVALRRTVSAAATADGLRRLPDLGTPPWWDVGTSARRITTTIPAWAAGVCRSTGSTASALAELGHEVGVFRVELLVAERRTGTAAAASHRRSGHGHAVRVATGRAIACHVAGGAAETADDVGGEVALLRAVVLAMAEPAAVLANLVFVVAEGTVKCGKFAKLVPLVVVLALRGRSSL
jgi:hypothetical protein